MWNMAEEVITGGTKVFRYEKDENLKADAQLKKEIEHGYEEYYERRKRERKARIIIISIIIFLILILVAGYFLIR